MKNILKLLTNNLLIIVLIVGGFSMICPSLGAGLGYIVTPVLAFMVFSVSMTIKMEDLKQVKKYPAVILWGAILQFVPMLLFSFMLGKIFLKSGYIGTGQVLLGSLPADISAPLMVYLVGGSTALATTMLIFAMLLTPIILPNTLSILAKVSFKVPTTYLIIELAGIILIPAILGVTLNYFSLKVRKNEEVWSGLASTCYVILLFVVVSCNAKAIISLKSFAFLILALEIALNLFGYAMAYTTKLIFKSDEAYLSVLFLASSKEFGIASAAVDTMKLSSAIVIPSTFYAVVQMISLPIVVKLMKFSIKKGREK